MTDSVKQLHILAMGGDLRQLAAARALAKRHRVTLCGFSQDTTEWDTQLQNVCRPQACQEQADVLLLPMPVTQDGTLLYAPYSANAIPLTDILPCCAPNGIVLGGRFGAAQQEMLQAANIPFEDYSLREEFAVRNAVPTAEGAIQLALQELPVTLHRLPCLILGAGRISLALQSRLRALGAEVTVAARRCSDLARAQCQEGKPLLFCFPELFCIHTKIFFSTNAHLSSVRGQLFSFEIDYFLRFCIDFAE